MKRQQTRWKLFMFDLVFYLFTGIFIFIIYPSVIEQLTTLEQIA